MNVLLADKLAAASVAALEALGCNVVSRPELTAEQLETEIADFEVLVVRSTKVTAATIDAAGCLALIIRAGAGVNTIDLAAASDRGIYVTNCPGKNAEAVAELAIGLLIAADRRIVDASVALRAGQWKKKEFGKAKGLKGRTLGVIGVGTIGQSVIARAHALEMNVVAWSRSLDDERAAQLGVGRMESPVALAAAADAVSLHVASGPETKHLVNTEFLAAMKPGAILVNTARGDIMDSVALSAAIAEKGLRVATDVFEAEPSGGDATFEQTELAERLTATPHIGASTEQASEAIADEVVRIVALFKANGTPPNTVNIQARSLASHTLVVRHYNRVGVLASVLDTLREQDINVEEMQNTIFAGAQSASCTLKLDAAPTPATIEQLRGHEYILAVTVEPLAS